MILTISSVQRQSEHGDSPDFCRCRSIIVFSPTHAGSRLNELPFVYNIITGLILEQYHIKSLFTVADIETETHTDTDRISTEPNCNLHWSSSLKGHLY